jgi:hypothetical protein
MGNYIRLSGIVGEEIIIEILRLQPQPLEKAITFSDLFKQLILSKRYPHLFAETYDGRCAFSEGILKDKNVNANSEGNTVLDTIVLDLLSLKKNDY